MCAAKGKLPYQGSRSMIFAIAPSALDPSGATGKPLGQCKGWVPSQRPAGGVYGYATDDIFYLEICLLNQICTNGDQLFRLRAGEEFVCAYSSQRFRDLQRMLLTTPEEDPSAKKCTGASLTKMKQRDAVDANGLPTCSTCWRVTGGPGDCSQLKGCDNTRCDFCTNSPAPSQEAAAGDV